MLIHPTKLARLPIRLHAFQSATMRLRISLLSSQILKDPETTTHNIVYNASTLLNKQNWQQNNLLKLLVSHMTPNVASQVVLLQGNNPDLGFRFFKAIVELIKECSENEDDILKLMDALDGLRKDGFKLNYPCYNGLLMSLAKLNLGFVAYIVYRRMVLDGFVIGAIDYRTIINALCKCGLVQAAEIENNLQEAFKVFEIMSKEDGCRPNSVTFSTLIHGLCEVGRLEEAFSLKEEIKENKLKEEYAMFGKILKYGVVPSVVTYTILIDGLSRAGEFSLALNTIKMMNLAGCPPNVYTYTVIINGLCQSGRLNEAQMLTFKMFDFGVSPNHITYTILVKAHVNAGRLDHALNIVSIMAVNGCQLNDRIFSALIKGLISSNKAIEVQSDGSSSHVDARPLRLEYNDDVDDKCVSNNVIREMDIEHARRLGDKIARCGGSITDLYNFLAAELCRAGRIAEADSITKDIVQRGSFPDIAISFIIEWYCKEGKYDNCLKFMTSILDGGFVPSFSSYCSVIQGLHNEGRSEEAERLVSDLLRFSGIEEKTVVLPYIDFLLKGDKSDKCLDLQSLIDQMHYRGRPVI
ncbi:hypothetical protein Pint_01492 [Pistacia integerrima]|uniref:Uncharacterized protein n=1 Tax=Pistacia integerrima TaxID=434235 RepID=A0ACC0ZL98_9ROSI|nr:hypothetical protein Pint_01492 [Pistacia integerrima]